MPVRSAYGDPNIAKAFDNLAGMFKPPSGADAYGFTKAASEKANAQRLAQLFNVAIDPNTPRETIDRYGVGSGSFNPSNSYYSVDQTNATSRSNNSATNRTTLDKARMDNEGALARQFALPITVAENATVRLPAQTAAATGLPGMFGGQVSAAQGETVRPADGNVLMGAPKPLNESEVKAAELTRLRNSGAIDDRQMNAIIFGNTPIEPVQTPEGPRNAYRTDAVGQAPVADASKASKPTVANYKLPDAGGKPGYAGTAVWDDAQGWKDSQTGVKLPQGAVTYSASLQGDKAATGLGPTTANNTSANNRGAEVTRTLNTLDLYEGLIKNNPGVSGFPGLIRGTAQNLVATASDLAQSFGKTVPEIEAAAKDIKNGLGKVAPELFDPAIPEAAFLQGTLAYGLARTENPSGEVSRQAYGAALDRIKGGFLSNPQQILAQTGAFRKVLQTELDSIGVLRAPGTARTDVGYREPGAPAPADAPAAVENWVRGPDGKLMRAQ